MQHFTKFRRIHHTAKRQCNDRRRKEYHHAPQSPDNEIGDHYLLQQEHPHRTDTNDHQDRCGKAQKKLPNIAAQDMHSTIADVKNTFKDRRDQRADGNTEQMRQNILKFS